MKALKESLRNSFRALGFDVMRVRESPSRILGTFPPAGYFFWIGRPENFFIHDGYRHRTEASYFDDTTFTDTTFEDVWQREVYQFAREIFDEHHLRKVCDVGCGSAFKLLSNFADCDIIGFDVKETCQWLRKKYPGHSWVELDFQNPAALQADLVIAADVIEHVLDPDMLLSFIEGLNPQYVVLSTPDRNLLGVGTHDGPPLNSTHIREWSFAEFHAYIGSRFEILEHFISNSSQGTQCLLCTPRLP